MGGQAGMDAEIRIVDGTEEELYALGEWLQDEDELRGQIYITERVLGSVAQVLVVALGAGGAGTVLATSLKTWLQTRRPTSKIIVKRGKTVTLTIETAEKVAPLLEQILKADDAG
jgi:hypothetical protein